MGISGIRENKNWFKTDRLQTSVPPEQLFIERIIQLLKEGENSIVLPDSILRFPRIRVYTILAN